MTTQLKAIIGFYSFSVNCSLKSQVTRTPVKTNLFKCPKAETRRKHYKQESTRLSEIILNALQCSSFLAWKEKETIPPKEREFYWKHVPCFYKRGKSQLGVGGVLFNLQNEGQDGGAERWVVTELFEVATVLSFSPHRHLDEANHGEEGHWQTLCHQCEAQPWAKLQRDKRDMAFYWHTFTTRGQWTSSCLGLLFKFDMQVDCSKVQVSLHNSMTIVPIIQLMFELQELVLVIISHFSRKKETRHNTIQM